MFRSCLKSISALILHPILAQLENIINQHCRAMLYLNKTRNVRYLIAIGNVFKLSVSFSKYFKLAQVQVYEYLIPDGKNADGELHHFFWTFGPLHSSLSIPRAFSIDLYSVRIIRIRRVLLFRFILSSVLSLWFVILELLVKIRLNFHFCFQYSHKPMGCGFILHA